MRRLALVLLALLLATATAQASPPPKHKHGKMSSLVPTPPRITPWRTDLLPFVVQSVPITITNVGTTKLYSLTVPVGQYWRVIAYNATFVTDVVAGNRKFIYSIADDQNQTIYTSGFPATAPPSTTITIAASPQVNTFANAGAAGTLQMDLQVPDLILRGGYSVNIQMTSAAATDATGAGQTALVEVYTEESAAQLAVAPITQTPLLT